MESESTTYTWTITKIENGNVYFSYWSVAIEQFDTPPNLLEKYDVTIDEFGKIISVKLA